MLCAKRECRNLREKVRTLPVGEFDRHLEKCKLCIYMKAQKINFKTETEVRMEYARV